MKKFVPAAATIALGVLLVVAVGCGPSQPDLPTGHPTKISKLHNLNSRMQGAGVQVNPSGATAPTK